MKGTTNYLKSATICVAASLAVNLPHGAFAEDPTSEISASSDTITAGNIARLIEVWGFVKYHHGDARAGRLAMDLEFFTLFPKIQSAESRTEGDAILADWLTQLGPGEPCDPCAGTSSEVVIPSTTPAWIAALPRELAVPVQAIFDNRSDSQANFQVARVRGPGNPLFLNEPNYSSVWQENDKAFQTLTLARQWNMLRYWFPYRDIMDEGPQAILPSAVESVLSASTEQQYQRAISRVGVQANDGHVTLNSYMPSWFPSGAGCMMPHGWRFIEDRLVIDDRKMPPQPFLRAGDVVLTIDGEPIQQIAERFRPFIAASNDTGLARKVSSGLRLGPCRMRDVEIERAGKRMLVSVEWQPWPAHRINALEAHFDPGETIEMLDGNIAYVRYQQLREADLPRLLSMANESSGLVLDMRGYVSDFLVFKLGGMLVDEPVAFVRLSKPNVATPGEFNWTDRNFLQPYPDGRRITVPVVALIDESAGSSAEYQSMGWRAAGVPIIGSPSAGADGDISKLPMPSGGEMVYSGLGVYYPDGAPTQRIGIVPDIEVKPTIAGIAAGRDEVLERGLEELERLAAER